MCDVLPTLPCRTMWKSDVVAQQQRALVLKSAEMLKHIAEAPAMRMGYVTLVFSALSLSVLSCFKSLHASALLQVFGNRSRLNDPFYVTLSMARKDLQ